MGTSRGTISITDVARLAEVSAATVSRVLNGRSTVNPALAARVRAAVEQVGYVPNGAGRALRRQQSDIWSAIVPDVQNPFFIAVVAGVEAVATARGCMVMLCNTNDALDRERHYINAAIAHRMSGVLVAVASTERSDLSPLRAAGIATVVVDRETHQPDVDSVLVDNRRAGQLVAQHLVAAGYRRLACIAGPPDVSTTENRLIGFRETLTSAGIDLPDSFVRRADLRADGAELAVRSLVSGPDRPDAVFATNGPSTVGAFRAIIAHGLRMPEDIGLAGTDDDVWTRMTSPHVTVVRQPVADIGRLAGEMLASRISGSHEAPHHLLLRPSLVARASTARRG